jgi:hypothetical protein
MLSPFPQPHLSRNVNLLKILLPHRKGSDQRKKFLLRKNLRGSHQKSGRMDHQNRLLLQQFLEYINDHLGPLPLLRKQGPLHLLSPGHHHLGRQVNL